MNQRLKSSVGLWVACATMLIVVAPASGHVQLNAPNGGEIFEAGSTTTIEWVIAIPHNSDNWDLFYSVTGDSGPWLNLAIDVPLGNNTQGSIHTFDWQIPDGIMTELGRVRVVQDNPFFDYEDVSNGDFTIVPEPSTLGLMLVGLLALRRVRRAG